MLPFSNPVKSQLSVLFFFYISGVVGPPSVQPFAGDKPSKIIDREDEYKRRRLLQQLSPARGDAFAQVRGIPPPSTLPRIPHPGGGDP